MEFKLKKQIKILIYCTLNINIPIESNIAKKNTLLV